MDTAFHISQGIESEAEHVARLVQPSVVEVRNRQGGSGSGIVWREDGLIVTNHHVASGDDIEVTLADGRVFAVVTIDRDPANDLALLHIGASQPSAATAGDSTSLRVGQLVFAIGHPMGMKGVVTSGIFSAHVHTRQGRELLQASIELRPGNSGGPLFDAMGRVIGISCMVSGPRVALAVPSQVVTRFVARTGNGPRIGISGRIVPVGPSLGTNRSEGARWGLVVLEVEEGTPASSAGLMLGDVVVEVDGQPLSEFGDELADIVAANHQGKIGMRVLRAGGQMQFVDIDQRIM